MYNYYPQNPQQPQYRMPVTQISGLKGRPVASIDEARAQTIDFDGSIFFFPDLANRRIYTKQINLDGTVLMNVYELSNPNPEQPQQSPYVTREELEKVLKQLTNPEAPKEFHF